MLRRCSAAAMFMAAGVMLGGGRQSPAQDRGGKLETSGVPVFVEPGPVERTVLYSTGEEIEVATQRVTRPICAGDPSKVTVDDLRRISQLAREAAIAHPYVGPAQGGAAAGSARFDLIFNVTTSLPPGGAEALAAVERFVESQFSDPITVVIDFAFSGLPPGVLGATSSFYTSVSWPAARDGLQADMDLDDTIQDLLPPGATIPVRYDALSSTVTDENIVFVTRANFRAAIGTINGTVAEITFSTGFPWDFTPPVIDPNALCFQSVIIHEVGHALGFVSGSDFRVNDIEMLDVYRFQRSDGPGTDRNPDTFAEFTTTPRTVDLNSPTPDDDANSDLIDVEYRMSDGGPYQASHFSESNPGIYIMDPAMDQGETFYPNFYRAADLAMFDAIGWDYPATNTTCGQAALTKCNTVRPFDNLSTGGAPSPAFSCGTGGLHDGAMWFSFVAEATSANISTCGSTKQDSTFAVYSGTCGELVEIACSEDGGCFSPGLSSLCVTGLEVGETYYVQVSAHSISEIGSYSLQIDCSCLGACCLIPPASCLDFQEDECASLGGAYAGPDVLCDTDTNSDGVIDVCERPDVKFSQLPTAEEEDSASSADLTDLAPSSIVSDEFTSDGRPIHAVRWWGSTLDPGVSPDGWFLAFHEPLSTGEPAETALGLYFCGADVVSVSATPIAACDPHDVAEYSVRLFDCCLVHAAADSRSSATPAQADAFHEELCFDYDLSIQAVVGSRYDFVAGSCTASSTGNSADAAFWGWHTTALEHGGRTALASSLSQSGTDWLYGPWGVLSPACADANAAFELVTTAPAGSGDHYIWHNGLPNDRDALASQYGGEVADWITVDDIVFPGGGTISDLLWYVEEESDFTWADRVRVEIYADNGAMAPVGNAAPVIGFWVPDSAGSVTRTDVGPGRFFERYRYDVSGINIVLGPGRWWVGLASSGATSTGRTYWNSSHTQSEDVLFFGGESYVRSVSGGIFPFAPWSSRIGGRKSDMAFAIFTPGFADCNCNGIDDLQDIADLTSADCNANAIPDECDEDCNENLIPDDCDIAGATSVDCQANGVPDECEIFLGYSDDANANDIPDECCEVVATPLPEASPVAKNRMITLRPTTNPGKRTALRVRLTSLQHPNPPNALAYPPQNFSAHEMTYRWVGPPVAYVDGTTPFAPFTAARLDCAPWIMDWSTVPVLHLYGPEVIPSSVYDVYAVEEDCVLSGELDTASAPLTIVTARWGDAVSPFNPPSTSTQPDSIDVASLVNKFKGLPGAPSIQSAKLQPAIINAAAQINAIDIALCVDAFVGKAYPYNGINACGP